MRRAWIQPVLLPGEGPASFLHYLHTPVGRGPAETPSSSPARRPLTCNTSALIMNHHLINIVRAASLTPQEEKQGRPLETSILPLSIAYCAITAPGLQSHLAPWEGKKRGEKKGENKLKKGEKRGQKRFFLLLAPLLPSGPHGPTEGYLPPIYPWTQRDQDHEPQG